MIVCLWLVGSCDRPEHSTLLDGQYRLPLFEEIQIQEKVIYGTKPTDHWMNVYQPAADLTGKRPLVILAPGGGFDPAHIDHSYRLLIPLAEKLAHCGYVVGLINYRTGETNSPEKYKKAFYSALYDLKAAIRFFRKDAEKENFYRIDPEEIYMGGWSAGAQIGLFNAYVNYPGELSLGQWEEMIEYGGFEGNSGNPGYSSQIKALIAMAGNTVHVKAIQPGDPALLCIHSTTDFTVRIDTQATPFGLAFGSRPLIQQAARMGLASKIIEIEGGTHTAPIKPDCPSCFDEVIGFIFDKLEKQ